MGLVNSHSGWSLPFQTRTIVDELNDAGYHTAHIGLQHERHPIEANRYRSEMAGSVFVEDVVDRAIAYLQARREGDAPFLSQLRHGRSARIALEQPPSGAARGRLPL